MTIQFLKRDRYHIDFTCDDDVASNELLIGIKKILHEYLSEFYAEINNEVWDYFAVEFWYDSGQLIIFPEKGINEIPTEFDPFPADRLDPYLIVRLTAYFNKYDVFIDKNYGKLSEDLFSDWYMESYKEFFETFSLALSEQRFANFFLKSLNRKSITFRYFGVTREVIWGEKMIS
ncbi:hypothetical protein [Acinetobacter venetianus]|uniref:hypothetical protein n=1 Tax=Acinetobacter venetianus TaxID=52133 RepID=UPI003A8E081E